MITRLFLLTLAITGVAGVAYAQSMDTTASPSMAPETTTQAMEPAGGQRHNVAITDEYGFHYDSQGDRLDAAGHIIAPPHTPSGARALQN